MKNKRGITLIALIITIIVLLILAGVVINMTVGNNGIIEKSQVATEKYKEASVKEQLEILMTEAKLKAMDEKQDFTAEYFKTYLETKLGDKVQVQIDESGMLEVTIDGYKIPVSVANKQASTEDTGNTETNPTLSYTDLNYVKDGLVVWYDGYFNTKNGHSGTATTWEDLSGNGIDATVNGNCTWTEDSLKMNGTSEQNASVTSTDIIDTLNNTSGNGFTISTVVKIKRNDQGVFSCGNSNSRCNKLHILVRNNGLAFDFYGNGYDGNDISSYYKQFITLDCIYNNGYKYVYINGELYGSASSDTLNIGENAEFFIGKETANSKYLNGEVREFRLFNKALSESEIAQNYTTYINRPLEKYVETTNEALTSPDDPRIIASDGMNYDFTDQWGRVALFQAFDKNYNTSAGSKKGGSDAVGEWIGYDFQKSVYVKEVEGKIRMHGYKIEYSDDLNNNWTPVINASSSCSERGDLISHEINNYKNIGPHRYWRLYVTANNPGDSRWGAMIDELEFTIIQ